MSEGTFLGRPVRGLQTMIRMISKMIPDIPSVIPDGIYGPSTMRAVTALQRHVHLPATGVADQATWDEIVRLYHDACEHLLPPQPLQLRMQPGQCVAPGEENLHMNLVEAMFQSLGKIYENVPHVEITGINDENCTGAICWLQTLSGLPVTGALDRRTWRYLAGLYQLACADGTVR